MCLHLQIVLPCYTLVYIGIFLACLRIQINDENKNEFSGISHERAFADFILAHVILHLVVANFLG